MRVYGSASDEAEEEMTDEQEAKLAQALAKIAWPVQYGSIMVIVRDWKPTLVKVEKTIKLD